MVHLTGNQFIAKSKYIHEFYLHQYTTSNKALVEHQDIVFKVQVLDNASNERVIGFCLASREQLSALSC